MTKALADHGASAGQTKVTAIKEEKQTLELMCQGQDGPMATLDLATYSIGFCVTGESICHTCIDVQMFARF